MSPAPAPTDATPLALTARKGFAWQGAAFVLARLTLLASTVVLARVLGPSDYGLISFGLTIVTALNVVSDFGASQAIVYLPRTPRRIDTALAQGILGSLLLVVLWVVSVPFLLDWLDEPDDALMLQVLSLVLVFTSIGQVPDAVLRKSLQFQKRLPGEMARGLTRGVVAITLALSGFGAWSLVWAEIAGSIAYAIVCWIMVDHRPGPIRHWVDPDEMRTILDFGFPAAVNGGLATVVLNVDYFVVISTLGAASLGYYFVGFRIPELVILSVFQIFSQVTYPLYAHVNGEVGRLRRGYLLSMRIQATYGFGAGIAIAVASPVIVPVLFGEKYAATVPVMSAIAIYAVFRSLSTGAVDVFKAVGRPKLGMWLGVGRLVLLVPALFLATRWGITGVAVAQAVMALLFTLATQQVVCRVIHLSWGTLLRALTPSALVGVGSGLGAWIGMLVVPGESWWSLIAAGVGTVLLGGAALLLLDRGTVRKVLRG